MASEFFFSDKVNGALLLLALSTRFRLQQGKVGESESWNWAASFNWAINGLTLDHYQAHLRPISSSPKILNCIKVPSVYPI